MTKNTLYHMTWKLRATGVLLLALALSTFPAAFSRAVNAQAPAKATAQTPARTTTSPAGESKGGQKEGIKVHGHWTIDVRNPDGTLVTHREFENALTSAGAAYLTRVMGRVSSWGTINYWAVSLSSAAGPAAFTPCWMVETTFPGALYNGWNKTLTATVPTSGDNANRLVLEGNCVAAAAGTIDTVMTENGILAGDDHFYPNTYVIIGGGVVHGVGVTSATLPQPNAPVVTVVQGQIVQVRVVISFS